jgi:hypothetical protein
MLCQRSEPRSRRSRSQLHPSSLLLLDRLVHVLSQARSGNRTRIPHRCTWHTASTSHAPPIAPLTPPPPAQRRPLARGKGLRRVVVLGRPLRDRVLLPHDGRPRGPRRHRREDRRHGLHVPPPHEGAPNKFGELRCRSPKGFCAGARRLCRTFACVRTRRSTCREMLACGLAVGGAPGCV